MRGGAIVKRIVWIVTLPVLSSAAFAEGPPPAKVVTGEVVQEDVAATQSGTGVLYYE